MAFDEYEIRLYRSEFFPQVVELLKYLLGNDHDNNKSYFKWKYDDNPNTEYPLGIMALYKGKVVGFRGYKKTPYGVKVAGEVWHDKLPKHIGRVIRIRKKGSSQ